MTVEEFLRARIAERKSIAQAATPGPWRWENEEFTDDDAVCPHGTPWTDHGPDLVTVAKPHIWADGGDAYPDIIISATGYDASSVDISRADAMHIVTNDPAAVLLQCEALEHMVDVCAALGQQGAVIMRYLTMAYVWHEDWQEEWATYPTPPDPYKAAKQMAVEHALAAQARQQESAGRIIATADDPKPPEQPDTRPKAKWEGIE